MICMHFLRHESKLSGGICHRPPGRAEAILLKIAADTREPSYHRSLPPPRDLRIFPGMMDARP